MKGNGWVPGRRRRYTPEQRAQLLREFERKTVSTEAFAATHGLGVSTLFAWQRLARQQARRTPPVPLREVALEEMLVRPGSWCAELQLLDGSCLRWNERVPVALLNAVLESLRRPCSP